MVQQKQGLKKVLSYRAILLITINSIMGTGIFFLPAVGAKHAGPASIISWVILSIIAIYISMCFAELTSMFPKAGGVYEFCKQAYGRFFSFIIGWMTIIAGNVTIAMLVVGAIQYLLPFRVPYMQIPISLFFVFVFNYVAYKGMKTSSFMLITFSFITVGTLLLLIIPSFMKIDPSNYTPFFPFSVSAILFTVFLLAETFFGWETATFLAAETKDGRKVMPKALIHATVIIAVICLLFVISSLGVMPWDKFGMSLAPLTDLGKLHYGSLGGDIFTLLVYLAIIGSVAGWIISAPRLILAMAEDRLFLSQFSAIHPVHKTPYKAIIFQTVLTTLLVIMGSGNYNILLQLLVPVVLVLYTFVLISLVIMRYTKPDIKRYYKAPFGKTGPILAVLLLLFFISMWVMEDPSENARILGLGGSLIALGIPLYFLLQLYYDPKTIVKVNDIFARATYITEDIFFPRWIRRRVLNLIGSIKGKRILEVGCGVGTLTMHLLEDTKPGGKVYAVNESKNEIDIMTKRAEKKGHKHLQMHLTEPHKLHHKIPKCDAAVSAGKIGSIEKEKELLKDINRKLKKEARIVFLEFDKFFDVIPNIEWLGKDEKIKELFGTAGFDVSIKRKQGFAWQYIYIYGKKVRDM
ncbi:MAG: amino acid permease [Candidatus Woesearchaeota archaeon]